jgi:hypothetical protein
VGKCDYENCTVVIQVIRVSFIFIIPTSHESGIIPELKIRLNKLTYRGKN